MANPILDLDINAKIPIIRVDRDENLIESDLNGYMLENVGNPQTNGLTNHHNGGKNHINRNNNDQELNLPRASFRKLPEEEYMKRTHTWSKARSNNKESYYHHEEPSAEELMTRVEYDMDGEDSDWLDSYNKTLSEKHNFTISENDFEKIMDRLEKESYFESQKSGQSNVPVIDQDAVCAICNDGECSDVNVILFCDLCDLAVHQECYGVPYIPEGQWLCRRCFHSPLRNVECVLCPNMGGAFKQTIDNRWAHVICALWIPEVCFANTVFLEPIDGIDQVSPDRWKLSCYICKQKRKGACIQCHKPSCFHSFHVTCAQQAGLYMKIKDHDYKSSDGNTYKDVMRLAFCDEHRPKNSKGSGKMYSGDEASDDRDSDSLRKEKKQIKKTRKLLAERREDCLKGDTLIKVDYDKLKEISIRAVGFRGRKLPGGGQLNPVKLEIVEAIHKHWQEKRVKRSGVPLLRRLHVSYYNNTPRPCDRANLNINAYTRLRYDLEKCRLLIGEVKKRELIRKKFYKLTTQIIEAQLKLIDRESPPDRT